MVKYYIELDDWCKNPEYITFEHSHQLLVCSDHRLVRIGKRIEYPTAAYTYSEVLKDLQNICKEIVPIHLQWRIPSEEEQETLRLLYE